MSEEPFLKRWSRRKIEAKDGARCGRSHACGRRRRARLGCPIARREAATHRAWGGAAGEARADRGRLRRRRFRGARLQVRLCAVSPRRGCPRPSRTRRCISCGCRTPSSPRPTRSRTTSHDYTDAAVAVPAGTLKTAYRIGKGFLTDEEVAVWEKLGHPAETEIAAKRRAERQPRRSNGGCGTAAGPPGVRCRGARRPARGARPTAPVGRLSRRPLPRREQSPDRRCGAGRAQRALPRGARWRRRGRLRRAGPGRRRRGRAQAHVRRPGGARPQDRRRILEALEAAGQAEGVRVIRLETGVRQPEVARPLPPPRLHRARPLRRLREATRSARFFEKWIG